MQMLKACIGYGFGIDWDADTFPPALFDDLAEKAREELVQDHFENEGHVPPLKPEGNHVSEYFDYVTLYAALYARIITGFPLLEAYTAGFYNDDQNPYIVVYIPSTRKNTTDGNVHSIVETEGTAEEQAQMEQFRRQYFPGKTASAIYWAELS